MKIIYDTEEQMYFVKVEYPETDLLIRTSDIAEARSEFVSCMTRLFNDTVCNQFAGDNEDVAQHDEVECDHEWECCCVLSAGLYYMCKKCGAHKIHPFVSTTSSINQAGKGVNL